MLPKRIEGATRVLGAPGDWDESRSGPCCSLPIRDDVIDGVRYMVSAWEPTPEEIELLKAGGALLLGINGIAHPVVFLSVQRPA
jgi:hypothetical protein